MAKKKVKKAGENDDVMELHGLIGDLRNEIASKSILIKNLGERLLAVEAEVFRPRPLRRFLSRLFRRRG